MRSTLTVVCLLIALGAMQGCARAPVVAPKGPVSVTLPRGWVGKVPSQATAIQLAVYANLDSYFELIAEPKSDYSDKTDLMAWAKLVKTNTAKVSKLTNRADTELRSGDIEGTPIIEYEITGQISTGMKLHYKVFMVQCGNYYCKLTCWTTPSHWDEAQSKFEELVPNLH